VIEQPLLSPQTATVTAQRAIGANDAMARDHNANHVRAIRAATARRAFSSPRCFAIHEYDRVSPTGIDCKIFQARN